MIHDSDKDILDNDLHQWTISIRDSIRSQIIECIRKREFAYTQNLKGYEIQNLYPFIARVYVQYQAALESLNTAQFSLAIPFEVSISSDAADVIEAYVDDVFNILLDKISNGFDVVGVENNSHDYHYFSPMSSSGSSKNINGDSHNPTNDWTLSYYTKDMKSNIIIDAYSLL